MAGIKEYKCLSCGAPLEFDAGSQNVSCNSCGNSFTVEALQAAQDADPNQSSFDWGDYKKDYGQGGIEGTNVYLCESCGAEIEADANTAATRCPYCDNNIVLTDRVSGGLRPNGVIPFKITKEQLPEYLKKFYKGKSLLPRGFFSNHVLSKAQGVYVPFWLYGCHLSGSMDFDAQTVRTYRDGNYDCTETSHYLLRRQGRMEFENVPVDASLKMDNDLMDSLEPFDFSELKPFDGAYLSGFVADKFDSTPDDEMDRAEGRMLKSAADEISSTANYGMVTVRSKNLKADDAKVSYVLLPVYLLNCEYGGKKYQYAVNGQTGKTVGELPVSKGKSWGFFGGAFAIIGAIAFGILALLLNM
ncbi:MAG: hypothetical protein IKR21_02085 [Oscillospiraceae bacterium]|nr:hypothetical protein [Oscillospiraceae bacterium]